MGKAMCVLVVLGGLLILSPTTALAAYGCELPENGKVVVQTSCGEEGILEVKVVTNLSNACVNPTCFGNAIGILVSGDEGQCTGAATLDAEGNAHTKTGCKNGGNTKILIDASSCIPNPCDD
jgi:hypothetical protein